MASIKNTAQKEQSVSIVNKNLPSFGTDKQLEASIGKQVRISRKNAGVTLAATLKAVTSYLQACSQKLRMVKLALL